MIDADRGRPDRRGADAQRLDDVAAERVDRLGAEPAHALVGVVAVQRRQVHAGDGAQQPGRLVVGLDAAPLGQRRDAPLQRAAVDVAHRFQEAEVERHAGIAGDAVAAAGALAATRAATRRQRGSVRNSVDPPRVILPLIFLPFLPACRCVRRCSRPPLCVARFRPFYRHSTMQQLPGRPICSQRDADLRSLRPGISDAREVGIARIVVGMRAVKPPLGLGHRGKLVDVEAAKAAAAAAGQLDRRQHQFALVVVADDVGLGGPVACPCR